MTFFKSFLEVMPSDDWMSSEVYVYRWFGTKIKEICGKDTYKDSGDKELEETITKFHETLDKMREASIDDLKELMPENIAISFHEYLENIK